MEINKKAIVNNLRKLQKKLIINEVSAQGFYTKFSKNSTQIMDMYDLFNGDVLSKEDFVNLLNGKKIKLRSSSKDAKDFSFFQRISKINNSNVQKIKETNVDCLYIGYPYVLGTSDKIKCANDISHIFRAPLLLWKIKIDQPDNTNIWLELEKEEGAIVPRINSGLIARVAAINKKDIDVFDSKFNLELDNKLIHNVINLYNEIGFRFKTDTNDIVNQFNSRTIVKFEKPEIHKKYFKDKLDLDDHFFSFCTIGIFTHQNISLFNMYTEMIESDSGIEFYKKIQSMYSKTGNEIVDFNENEIKQITSLDFTQKKAIKLALNNSLVIQGPPGTGKSQTITNIIANAVYNNKKILFVTEKYVAAEVVDKRLNKLNKFSLPIFDIQKTSSKNIFYDKIKKIYDDYDYCNAVMNSNIVVETIENDFRILQKHSEWKQTSDVEKFIKVCKDKGSFSECKEWLTNFSLLPLEKNAEDFWNLINIFYYERENYYFWNNFFNENKLVKDDIKTINNVLDFFGNKKINQQDLAFFIRKGKIKKKYGFFSKFWNQKIINRNPRIFKYFEVNNVFPIEKLKSFSLNKYVDFDSRKNSQITKQYDAFLKQYNITNFDYQKIINYKFYNQFINKYQEFLNIDTSKIKEELKTLLKQKTKYDLSDIYAKVIEYICKTRESNNELEKECSDLYNHSIGQRRRGIDWAIKRYKKAINLNFPIIISNPDTAATLFKDYKFDYVIIDEASQVTLERSLPILYLGDICIISGDKQQLQPTDFFQAKLKEEYEDTFDESDEIIDSGLEDIEDSGSLLEFTEKKFRNIMLNYHYRSSKRELIQFSNVCFYDGKLVIANSPSNNLPGIEVIEVKNGVWDGKTNLNEAKEIVKLIKKITREKNHGSIGVITFNINQKYLIDDLLYNENDEFIKAEQNRKSDTGGDQSLFVKNLENVQGDERDIIIFSITYSKTTGGEFRQSFGPINKKGGQNRINVAVSRSKDKMYIFKSISSNSITREGPEGRKIFHDYLEYVELYNKTKDLESKEIKNLFLKYINNEQEEGDTTPTFDSDFEIDVYNALRQLPELKNYEFITQLQQSGYKIDLVIKNKKSGNYILAIECDGRPYHKANIAQREYDFYRQKYLEDRGWIFKRIDSLDWYRGDTKKIINDIKNTILQLDKTK